MKIEDFANQSIENRAEFLKPYKAKFDALDPKKDRRKRARIVIDLICMLPSHLNEPWIRREVVDWKDDPDCGNYMVEVSKVPTFKQKFKPIRNAMIYGRVERIVKQGLSINLACDELAKEFYKREAKTAFMWNIEDPDFDLSGAIRNAYFQHKRMLKDGLPWPYYGRDVSVKPHEP